MKRKLCSPRGATLTEMLCVVVVLLLMTGLLATGAAFTVRAYRSSMADSQAQLLSSTLRTAITDKLRYCGSVEGDKIFLQDIGAASTFGLNENGEVILDTAGEEKLLGSNAYPRGLRVSELSVRFSASDERFAVSYKVTDSTGAVLSTADFEVGRLNHAISAEG